VKTPFSDPFFSTLDAAHRGIVGVGAEIQMEARLPAILPEWFTALWHVIRATEPTLQRCVARLESCQGDAFEQDLLAFYRHKLVDEADHGVWLLADLEHLGMTRASLDRTLPAAPITALVGSQTYWIDYVHPAAYLGYMALLEGYMPDPSQLEMLIETSGAPREAFATVAFHATEDIGHRKDLERILDAVPQDAFLREVILANGIRCADYFCQALEGMLARARAREARSAGRSAPANAVCAS
jgi:hypothetical protein